MRMLESDHLVLVARREERLSALAEEIATVGRPLPMVLSHASRCLEFADEHDTKLCGRFDLLKSCNSRS